MSRDSPAATAWAGSPARFSLGALEAGAFLVGEDFEATVADFGDPGERALYSGVRSRSTSATGRWAMQEHAPRREAPAADP